MSPFPLSAQGALSPTIRLRSHPSQDRRASQSSQDKGERAACDKASPFATENFLCATEPISRHSDFSRPSRTTYIRKTFSRHLFYSTIRPTCRTLHDHPSSGLNRLVTDRDTFSFPYLHNKTSYWGTSYKNMGGLAYNLPPDHSGGPCIGQYRTRTWGATSITSKLNHFSGHDDGG